MADARVTTINHTEEVDPTLPWHASISGFFKHITELDSESHQWCPQRCISFLTYVSRRRKNSPMHEVLNGLLATIRKSDLKAIDNDGLSNKVIRTVKVILNYSHRHYKTNKSEFEQVLALTSGKSAFVGTF